MDTIHILNEVMRLVFDDNALTVHRETTANEVNGWDSMSHVNLIIALEDRFGITFNQKEALHFKNVGELIDNIEKLTGYR